jgi:hypothetical protein
MVVGATNSPDRLDPALRRAGRFDHEITMGMPDEPARAAILRTLCRSVAIGAESMDAIEFDRIARHTAGYVGADLLALTREAGQTAIRRIFKDLLPPEAAAAGAAATATGAAQPADEKAAGTTAAAAASALDSKAGDDDVDMADGERPVERERHDGRADGASVARSAPVAAAAASGSSKSSMTLDQWRMLVYVSMCPYRRNLRLTVCVAWCAVCCARCAESVSRLRRNWVVCVWRRPTFWTLCRACSRLPSARALPPLRM